MEEPTVGVESRAREPAAAASTVERGIEIDGGEIEIEGQLEDEERRGTVLHRLLAWVQDPLSRLTLTSAQSSGAGVRLLRSAPKCESVASADTHAWSASPCQAPGMMLCHSRRVPHPRSAPSVAPSAVRGCGLIMSSCSVHMLRVRMLRLLSALCSLCLLHRRRRPVIAPLRGEWRPGCVDSSGVSFSESRARGGTFLVADCPQDRSSMRHAVSMPSLAEAATASAAGRDGGDDIIMRGAAEVLDAWEGWESMVGLEGATTSSARRPRSATAGLGCTGGARSEVLDEAEESAEEQLLEVWENQRYYAAFGWHAPGTSRCLPSSFSRADRARETDKLTERCERRCRRPRS